MTSPRSLLECADLIRGVSYKREEARSAPGVGLIPVLRANNVQAGRLIYEDLVYVPSRRVADVQRLRKNDIVLAMSSGSRDIVGKAALADDDWDGGFGAFCGVLRAKSGINPGWLAHFMRSPQYRAAIDDAATGTNINNLSRTTLNEVLVPACDEETQDAIRRLLDRSAILNYTASAHLSSARLAMERFRQAVLAAACSGRLTADWRDQRGTRESAESLIERSKAIVELTARHTASTDDWTAPEWIDLPDSWRWAPMRNLGVIRGGIQKQPKRTPKENAYPYLRVANVLRGRLDLRQLTKFELYGSEAETYRLMSGDLLVVEGNGSAREIGRAAVWRGEIDNCVHQNHIIRVRPVFIDPDFLEMFWNSPIGAREVASLAVTSAGLYSLSTKKIGAVPVPVAPHDEQLEIVRRASALLATADGLLTRIDAASGRVDRSSQAVLARAFRGELVAGGVV